MFINFKATVSAICYSIIQERGKLDIDKLDFPHNRVVAFVLHQHGEMPDYLRLPIFLLTLIFDFWGIVTTGKFFHSLPHAERWRQIQAWQNSSIALCRDVIRFYESLVVFCWYSNQTSECLLTPVPMSSPIPSHS